MDFPLAQHGINLLVGAVLGIVSGTLGIGGGLLAIPLLVLSYGMDQQVAQGTALVVMAPNMLIGFLRYRERNPITFRMALLLGSGSIVVSYFASLAAARVSNDILRLLVAVLMMGLAVNMVWRSYVRHQAKTARRAAPHSLLPLVGGFGGFCSGFFTIGGGVLVIPVLTAFFGFAQTAAQGLALAMLVPGTLVALATYGHLGLVNWVAAVPMAVGSIATVSYGVVLAHKLPEKQLRRIFAVVLFVSAIMMINR